MSGSRASQPASDRKILGPSLLCMCAALPNLHIPESIPLLLSYIIINLSVKITAQFWWVWNLSLPQGLLNHEGGSITCCVRSQPNNCRIQNFLVVSTTSFFILSNRFRIHPSTHPRTPTQPPFNNVVLAASIKLTYIISRVLTRNWLMSFLINWIFIGKQEGFITFLESLQLNKWYFKRSAAYTDGKEVQ